jgi:hypothetical protein
LGSAVGAFSLAGCSAGSERGEVNWAPDGSSYGPGGASGFAGNFRDFLVEAGAPSGDVRAHSTVGHVTNNPAARVFPVASSEKGQPGKSALDLAFGHAGAWREAGNRRQWVNAFQGEPSEKWIIGGSLPSLS